MVNLIKADLKKVLKDKLFLVLLILALVFAVITPLLNYGISNLGEVAEMLNGGFYAKNIFFNSFSPANNFGLIAPFLLAIILYKDFSSGTIRNKIISGHSRGSIFFSMFTVCFIVIWFIILFHALISLLVSLIFFDFQANSFTVSDFFYLLESLLLQMLVYLFIAAFISRLCAVTSNMGIVIVLYISVVFGLTMVSAILQMGIGYAQISGKESALELMTFFQKINIFNSYMYIGSGTSYELKDLLYLILLPICSSAFLLSTAVAKFRRKDLK